jgi:hypothetical protein
MGMVARACHTSTLEVEKEHQFEGSMGYTVRACFKTKTKQKQNKEQKTKPKHKATAATSYIQPPPSPSHLSALAGLGDHQSLFNTSPSLGRKEIYQSSKQVKSTT